MKFLGRTKGTSAPIGLLKNQRTQWERIMKNPVLGLLLRVLAMACPPQSPALAGPSEDVQAAMQVLKSKAAALGAPHVKGEEAVAGKTVPAIYFGETEMNNNFAFVDEIQKEKGGTATIFVKSGNDFVRVATNVKKLERTTDRARLEPYLIQRVRPSCLPRRERAFMEKCRS